MGEEALDGETMEDEFLCIQRCHKRVQFRIPFLSSRGLFIKNLKQSKRFKPN